MEAVFNTAELLEHILIHLPRLDIHFLRRVSTFWRGVIENSPRIRQMYWLDPIKENRCSSEWILGEEDKDHAFSTDLMFNTPPRYLLFNTPPSPIAHSQLELNPNLAPAGLNYSDRRDKRHPRNYFNVTESKQVALQ